MEGAYSNKPVGPGFKDRFGGMVRCKFAGRQEALGLFRQREKATPKTL